VTDEDSSDKEKPKADSDSGKFNKVVHFGQKVNKNLFVQNPAEGKRKSNQPVVTCRTKRKTPRNRERTTNRERKKRPSR
jgi:hypothetical protein